MSKPEIRRYSSRVLAAKRAKGSNRTDWPRIRAMSDNAASRNARADRDNPPLTARDFARAKVVRRGRPKSKNPKKQVTLRLSPEVLSYYRARGAGWQSRIDADLKKLASR